MSEPRRDLRPGPEEHRLQGHWLLAKMGKRVLRPGGIEMTQRLLSAAAPSTTDRIVEFGPGVGRTAEHLLAVNPVSYTAVDPNPEGAPALAEVMAPYPQAQKVTADAAETGLEDGCADLVVGEAMLTMQSPAGKAAIVAEAARILAPGGRYLVHELGFHPDNLPAEVVKEVQKGLSRSIKVGARPLTEQEWRKLLESAGLEVEFVWTNAMALLEPKRMIQDEGLGGFLKFVKNMVTNPAGRKRVLGMRKVFRANREYLNAIGLVARKL
ncbi:class I SAM-dependent methyltransferase [Boudabousia marimammalium]|uniref:SAM-dependent methyltransferase n=1 Tax=Boudabousia marimammalium TaxID=156892 RepID=A0A1Q5PKH3_9ACTO|nr:class I SAM-dependent methyltransferase [Boudabousia marimammalium]OKL46712.1 SAM-dependent methyltransferase [Boudabousia marimammalium]